MGRWDQTMTQQFRRSWTVDHGSRQRNEKTTLIILTKKNKKVSWRFFTTEWVGLDSDNFLHFGSDRKKEEHSPMDLVPLLSSFIPSWTSVSTHSLSVSVSYSEIFVQLISSNFTCSSIYDAGCYAAFIFHLLGNSWVFLARENNSWGHFIWWLSPALSLQWSPL